MRAYHEIYPSGVVASVTLTPTAVQYTVRDVDGTVAWIAELETRHAKSRKRFISASAEQDRHAASLNERRS